MMQTKASVAPSLEPHVTKLKRGRPKSFDEQKALQQAMLLFWEYGYEATSISDLTQALGITAPSLYCSFGDKVQLFQKSIQYYLEHEACSLKLICDKSKTAKIAVELYFHESIKRLALTDKPAGCMLVTTTMNCSQQAQTVKQEVSAVRQSSRELLLERLKRGMQEGDLPAHTPVQLMVDFYNTVMQGLTLQARDGVPIEQLQSVVQHALKHWDLFLQPN